MIKGLARDAFVCKSTFRREIESIFSKYWLAVHEQDDFASEPPESSSFCTVNVGDQSLIVVRKPSGELSGFHNVCRHRGTRLLVENCGTLRNDCVTCPYHAWSYNTDGKLLGAPNMTDVEDFERADFPLVTVGTAQWAQLVFLNIDTAAAPFQKAMQPLLSRLENWQLDKLHIVHTLEYTVQANWKLIFQNYSECYHCPTVHPDLNQQTPYKTATNDLLEGPILGGPMQLADGFQTISHDGQLVGPIFENLTAEQRRSVYYYTVFPNMFVSAHPDYVMIHQLHPLDVCTTQVSCHFLSGPSATVDSLAGAWKMWDTVNRQDWRVCELTQKGAQSTAFQPGPYSNLESM
ncbi:MAG: aromatic ring-hydroxylating dioxygenase subunit alpha, partial [Pirellulaceae bacterium]|nr:aromatic ring-hydroxylating dioxygenase subunit alpha [Pirellulaceae bacterium]